MEKNIKAEDMRSCLCCSKATHFRMSPEDDELDDITVVCPHYPKGNKLIEIAFDCEYFSNIFMVTHYLKEQRKL